MDQGVVLPMDRRREVRTILVIDDDERLLAAYARGDNPFRVLTAPSADRALRIAQQHSPDLALVDMRLGTASGIDLVRDLKQIYPHMIVVMCSAYMSVVAAVAAMRAGADEILPKPVTLREVIRRVEENALLQADNGDTPTLARVEWEHIMRVLSDCDGNLSEAARRLGIYRSTLKRRLRKYAPD